MKKGGKHNKILWEVKVQTDHGQKKLSNILVKKNVLNEINKEGTFTQGLKDCRKVKRKVSQNLDDLQNLLIKLAVKVKPVQTVRESVTTLWVSI